MTTSGISPYKYARIVLLVAGGLFIARKTLIIAADVDGSGVRVAVCLVGFSMALVAVGSGLRLATTPYR